MLGRKHERVGRFGRQWRVAAVFALLAGVTAGVAEAQSREQLVPANYNARSDAMGFNWDINQTGAVNDGTGDCFDTGLALHVNGQQFSASQGMMTADGSEYVLSRNMFGVEITRRVKLDPQRAVCRYLEIFENTGQSKVTLTVSIRSMLGSSCQGLFNQDGQPFSGAMGRDDIGFMAISSSSRPSVMFLVAGHRSNNKPQVSNNGNRTFEVIYPVEVGPRQTVVLLHMVAQRRNIHMGNVAQTFETFYKRKLVDPDVPREYRSKIENFRLGGVIAGALVGQSLMQPVIETAESYGVERGDESVLVVDMDTQLQGRVTGGDVTVQTRYGRTTVPLADVALLYGGRGVGRTMRLYLRNGEILNGVVGIDELKMRTSDGVELPLSPDRVNLLFLPKSSADGKAAADVQAYVQTAWRDRLAVSGGLDQMVQAVTAWGSIEVPLSEVAQLRHVREPFPGCRLTMRDGSQFTAIVLNERLTLKTALYDELDLLQQAVSVYRLKEAAPVVLTDENDEPKRAYVRLVGETTFVGKLAGESLHVIGAAEQDVPITQIARLERNASPSTDGPTPEFAIRTFDGGEIVGRLSQRVIGVECMGRVWNIPAEHVEMAAAPKPRPKPAPGEEDEPGDGPGSDEGEVAGDEDDGNAVEQITVDQTPPRVRTIRDLVQYAAELRTLEAGVDPAEQRIATLRQAVFDAGDEQAAMRARRELETAEQVQARRRARIEQLRAALQAFEQSQQIEAPDAIEPQR